MSEHRVIPWTEIEAKYVGGMTSIELGLEYGIASGSVRKRAQRKNWLQPKKIEQQIARIAIKRGAEKAIEKLADKWAEKGETHRAMVFKLAHESLAKMQPKAPKSFREAEAADKMARRAAGLENDDNGRNQVLININEAIDAADMPTPIDAEIVQLPSKTAESQEAELLPLESA